MKSKEVLSELRGLYEREDYEQAIDLLLQYKDSMPRGIFHYYLGNTYAHKGVFGAARFNLEEAKNWGVSDSILANNISFIKENLRVRDISTERSTWQQIDNFFYSAPLEYFLFASLFVSFSFFLLAKLRGFLEKKRKQFVGMGVLLFILPLASSLTIRKDRNYAVSLESAKVFTGPSVVFPSISEIPEGHKIRLGKSEGKFIFVEGPGFFRGWVQREKFGILREKRI